MARLQYDEEVRRCTNDRCSNARWGYSRPAKATGNEPADEVSKIDFVALKKFLEGGHYADGNIHVTVDADNGIYYQAMVSEIVGAKDDGLLDSLLEAFPLL